MSTDKHHGLVFIVDDQKEFADGMNKLIISISIKTEVYHSPSAFLERLAANPPSCRCCVILDLVMPEMSGLAVMSHMRQMEIHLPVIMVSGYADVSGAVQAMRLGAVDFIQKPINVDAIIDRVHESLKLSEERIAHDRTHRHLLECAVKLTPREKQILDCISDGHNTKEVALALGITTNTVDSHRSHIMQKMKVQSLEQLILAGLRLQKKMP